MIRKIKNLLKRLIWFKKNYFKINNNSEIVNSQLKMQIPYWFGPQFGLTYNTDGLATCNNCDFITEPRFAKAYQAAANTKPWEGFTLQWRTYIVCWFADRVKNSEGDFVECGVNTGAYSRAVVDYIDFKNLDKTFYLLDTFDGYPIEQITDAEKKAGVAVYESQYHDVYEEVKKTFKDFNVKIIQGRVPETLTACTTNKIAYLSIDMNAVAPEIAAINYFWDKVVKGGVVILDDYGFPMHINQKLAFDEFALKNNISILSLPTGQGIIIK